MRPWLVALACAALAEAALAGPTLKDSIETVRRAGPDGEGGAAAAKAWRQLAAAGPADLPTLLAGMDGASPLARNWIRSAIDRVLEQAAASKQPLPTAALDAFLREPKHDPRARRLAYDLLCEADPTAPERYLPNMLDDPSPDLRRDAVARVLAQAERLSAAGKKAEALPLFRDAFAAARERGQIDAAARKLRDLGEKVDLPARLGMLMTWKLIGPFPNKDKKGMATAYPPEKALDFAAEYDGKAGKLKWVDYTSKDDYGLVDLKEALKDHAEVVSYAAAEFPSADAREVDVRLGCFTGFKLWVNGELVLERGDAYTGMKLDHYLARARLKPGKNVLLLKVAQDEPPPQLPAALRFQLRVCDAGGKAVLASDRK
jgi:hypothetical protein